MNAFDSSERGSAIAIINARLQGKPIPQEAVNVMQPLWREQEIRELEAEREKLKDDLRFDLFSLPDVLDIEEVKSPAGREASRLILIEGYRQELVVIEKRLARLRALQRVASGEAERPGMITDEEIMQAKAIPILDLAPELTFQQRGNKQVGLCCFHEEKTPSLTVFPDNGFFCFGCAAKGDAITFARKLRNLSFPDAVRFCLETGGAA